MSEGARPSLELLPFGTVRPSGWLAARMRRDLDGFVGHLAALVPELIVEDDIYGRDRLTSAIEAKDVGAILHTDDAAARAQFLWWNSETQSNWRDGWIRHVLLVGTDAERSAARAYVDRMLGTADADGYLGIYGPDLRFPTSGENGELWAQATLGRALLAYIEGTADREHAAQVLVALQRSVDLTLQAYLGSGRTPFPSDAGGGGAHGLMFVDVLDGLWRLGRDARYLSAAAELYRQSGDSGNAEDDAAPRQLLQSDVPFAGHGVHTYEHLRALVLSVRADAPGAEALLEAYLRKLHDCVTPAGGPIGDEWIRGRSADASTTGYELCSSVEYLDSLIALMAASGDLRWADAVERTCFNAAFGAWHPELSAIAYLQTDNAFSMAGNRYGAEPDATQTRYRYSPVHREAAVCCVPNAGRLLPTYLRGAVLRDPQGFTLALYGAVQVQTAWNQAEVRISVETEFPYGHDARISIAASSATAFTLTLRMPSWCTGLSVTVPDGATMVRHTDRVEIAHVWQDEVLEVRFDAQPHIVVAGAEAHVEFGPLLYALPIPSTRTLTRAYGVAGLCDVTEMPSDESHFEYALAAEDEALIEVTSDGLRVPLRPLAGGTAVMRTLAPLGRHALRRVTFPLATGPQRGSGA